MKKINDSKQNVLDISTEKENLEKKMNRKEKEKNETISQLQAEVQRLEEEHSWLEETVNTPKDNVVIQTETTCT